MIEWVGLGQAPPNAVDLVDGVQVVNQQTAKSILLMLGQLYPLITPPEESPGPTYIRAVDCEEYKKVTNQECKVTAYSTVTTAEPGATVMVNLADGNYQQMQLVVLPSELKDSVVTFAGSGSDLAVLKVEQVTKKPKTAPKDSAAAVVIGAMAGGALGFAMGGPVGAAVGGSSGVLIANWFVSS